MRLRWRTILCLWGLTLFGLLTLGSTQTNSLRTTADRRPQRQHNRYFWWGSVRLDADPLNQHPRLKPCVEESDENCDWDPEEIWVAPGLIERSLIFTAFPAFLLANALVRGLAHLGVSEVLSFMVAMPLFTLAWFYPVGWLLDRWQFRRSLRRAPAVNG